MKLTYRALAMLIAILVVAQAATIALAWFTTLNDIDNGAVLDQDYEGNVGHVLHGMVGMMVIPLVALVLFVVSFFTKVPGAVKWAGFVLLAAVVQVALAFTAFGAPAVGALHGINAFVLGGLAGSAASKIGRPVPAEQRESVPA